MIISKINTEIETFCMDSDFRQSYPLIVFWGRGYDLDTQPCLFVPLFCLSGKTETIKKVLQYVDIVGLVSFFVAVWLCSYVIQLGLEPRTPTLKVLCSTG